VKAVFALIVVVHGMIHLMGFAKAFRYAEIAQASRVDHAAGRRVVAAGRAAVRGERVPPVRRARIPLGGFGRGSDDNIHRTQLS